MKHQSTVLPLYLKNSSILLALQRKSRGHIYGGRRRRRTGKRLGHVHRGVNVAVDGGSRAGCHDGLDDFRARYSLRRDSNRNVNRARDDVALRYRRRGDGDGGGICAGCKDHVRARVWGSLADAGAAGRCAD